MQANGSLKPVRHGCNLHVKVRPEAPVQLVFTGHMDPVFGVDHPFQAVFWREKHKVLGGPGVADLKVGIAVMLAELKAVEASAEAQSLAYAHVINTPEEVGSADLAASPAYGAGCPHGSPTT